jgi:competence protein ComEC
MYAFSGWTRVPVILPDLASLRANLFISSLCLIGPALFGSTLVDVALPLVLLIDPFAPLSAGFWLSFGAIAVIFFGMWARINNTGICWYWGRAQYVVAIGSPPFLA